MSVTVSRAPAEGDEPAPAGRRGRRPGASDARARILAAARAAFAERGLEAATVRDVAHRAGVDAALVHHYFGTKHRLFVVAMEFPVDVETVVPALLAGPREDLGERFVRFVVREWDKPEVRQLVTGVIRSASTDASAAAMLRQTLVEGPLLVLGRSLDRPDAGLRASLAGSQLIGLAMARYVVGIEPLASMAPEEIAAIVGPVVGQYLEGPLGATGAPSPG